VSGEPAEAGTVRGSQAIERALGILLTFSMESPALHLRDICDRTGLTMSTAHRMLKALSKAGFVVQHPADGSYRLGPAVVSLSRVVLNGTSRSMLAAICLPYLEDIRNRTGETAGLHMPSADGRVCVAEAESRQMMRMATGVGTEFPWHAGAASKALLSGMTPEQRAQALARATWRQISSGTPRDGERLREEIETAADQGYALSVGETVEGASAIAMPVRSADGQVVAAINVTGPSIRWTRERMVDAVPLLGSVIARVERELGTR